MSEAVANTGATAELCTDAAPSRGDIASFTLLSNPAIAGMPNLRTAGNVAFTSAGRRRNLSLKIEGA